MDVDFYTGRKINDGDQWMIRLADGRDVTIDADEIEDARPSDQTIATRA